MLLCSLVQFSCVSFGFHVYLSDSVGPTQSLSDQKVYGEPLLSHLTRSDREIAAPIQECIQMLLTTGMREEVDQRCFKDGESQEIKATLNQIVLDLLKQATSCLSTLQIHRQLPHGVFLSLRRVCFVSLQQLRW